VQSTAVVHVLTNRNAAGGLGSCTRSPMMGSQMTMTASYRRHSRGSSVGWSTRAYTTSAGVVAVSSSR
jgi:hypothetical protein